MATALVTLTWVQPGAFIAAGDVAPFETRNTAAELTSLWNHQITGSGSHSYIIVNIFQVVLTRLVGVVGLSPTVAQYLFYALLWSYAAFGGAYLAAVWTRRASAMVFAGLAAAFNAYLMVAFPNPLPALAIGLTGTLVGMVLRAGAGRGVSARTLALATLPASYLAQNPPLLALLAVCVVLSALASGMLVTRSAPRRSAMLLLRAAPWALAVNLWWLVPLVLTLGDASGLVLDATTDVRQWSWTHARASIGNVLTLNAHWGWHNPGYFPFSAAMESAGWPVLRWGMPALALAGVLLSDRSRRKPAVILGLVCAGCAVLGTGLHPPLGPVNQWMFDHVPGMWLLRDPAMKLAVVQVLCYGALGAVAIDRVLSMRSFSLRLMGLRLGVGAVVLCALGYPWPLWTGEIVPETKASFPGSHVRVPQDWHEVADAVNESSSQGKVLVLPLDPYYQVTTTWGYHGVDTIPRQLLERPVVYRLPGGYLRAAGSADELASLAESTLLAGQRAIALNVLRALGVGQVIVRNDLLARSGAQPFADPEALRASADAMLVRTSHFPIADVYQVPDASGPVAAFSTISSVVADDSEATLRAMLGRAGDSVTTRDTGIASDGVLWRPGVRDLFTLAERGSYQLAPYSEAPVMQVGLIKQNRGAALRFTDPLWMAVDGAPLPQQAPLDIPLDPGVAAIELDGRLQSLAEVGGSVQLPGPVRLTQYVVAEQGGLSEFGSVGDCARLDDQDPNITLTRPEPAVVRLGADQHSACVSAPLPGQPAQAAYRVRFEYRGVSGHPARICLWQERVRGCVGLPRPAASQDWRTYDTTVRIASEAGPVSLFLYADGGASQRTVVEYREVRVDPLRPLADVTIEPPSASPVERVLEAGSHTVTAGTTLTQPQLGDMGDLGNCNNSTGRSPEERGLRLERPDSGTVLLSAPADIACVRLVLEKPIGSQYRLEMEHRTVAGQTARICLWQVGPNRCAALPELPRTGSWTRLSAPFRIEPGTTKVELFLYAVGQTDPKTTVGFRDMTITPETGTALSITRSAGVPSAPALAVTQRAVADFQVAVSGANGRFALVLAEADVPGWRLSGLPPGWSAQRFTAHGYAAGWLVTGQGDALLSVAYGPNRLGGAARHASMIAVVLLLLTHLAARYRDRVAAWFPGRL
ncbi:MAG: hypothetical protein JXA67_08915, partial [Micromonosporaceae bacterium]|nr:hypothetical protein [Micromonosporaceae bacterium]